MRRIALLAFCLSIASFSSYSQEFNIKLKQPVREFMVGVSEVTPPWSLGAEATYLSFPFAIPFDDGGRGLLGFGVQGAYYIEFEDGINPLRICALFDGRFQFKEKVGVDIDTGLGFLFAGGGAAFMGTMGIGVPIKLSDSMYIRPYAGCDFSGNPNYDVLDYYSSQAIIWLHASICAGFIL
ncbi:MAG TPA: hypothetical protein P5298_11625 [Spirochaetia bacterium]|nr:hypothetical protein [Spirochaetia bacterium]